MKEMPQAIAHYKVYQGEPTTLLNILEPSARLHNRICLDDKTNNIFHHH